MIEFYLVVTLCLSMTSLITCSQDTCPVVSYKGRKEDIKNHVKDRAILGYSYKNLTTDSIHKCFSACVQDCRCVSSQVKGSRCELADENRHTAPDNFKPVLGYEYLELKQEFRNKRSGSCSSQCYNGCCRTSPCQNGGTCIELCDNVTRKFECKCKPGFSGRGCELPISCAAYSSKKSAGLYTIFTSKYNKLNVYCDMISEPGMVWTLVESFALSNKNKYTSKNFPENFPVNEKNFNWIDYRLSLSTMQHINRDSTHWRATCCYEADGLVKTDYMRGKKTDIDIVTYSSGDACHRVEYINVRGKDCTSCTTHMRQDKTAHIFVDSWYGQNLNCYINFVDGSVNSGYPHYYCDNFGKYTTTNGAHRCTHNSSSTTQWWLGLKI